jgi:hypothetical protein
MINPFRYAAAPTPKDLRPRSPVCTCTPITKSSSAARQDPDLKIVIAALSSAVYRDPTNHEVYKEALIAMMSISHRLGKLDTLDNTATEKEMGKEKK